MSNEVASRIKDELWRMNHSKQFKSQQRFCKENSYFVSACSKFLFTAAESFEKQAGLVIEQFDFLEPLMSLFNSIILDDDYDSDVGLFGYIPTSCPDFELSKRLHNFQSEHLMKKICIVMIKQIMMQGSRIATFLFALQVHADMFT